MKTFCLIIFIAFSFGNVTGQCTAGTLFGVNGGSDENINSRLFTIDPATGAHITEIGDIGYSGVKGIAINPLTFEMFGVAKPNGSSGNSVQLIKINMTTGAGSPVGPLIPTKIVDLTFSPTGQLYALDKNNEEIIIINTADASTTTFTAVDPNYFGETGISFDKTGGLFIKSNDSLHMIDIITGMEISSVTLNNGRVVSTTNSLTCDNNNVLFSMNFRSDLDTLFTIDKVTGVITSIGATDTEARYNDNATAIEFCPVSLNSIPTLSQWGLIVLGFSFLIIGFLAIKEKNLSIA